MARNVFVSFAMEDRRLTESFRAQARSSRSEIELRDYSVRESFERAWKTQVEHLIRRCSATISLVGESTSSSTAVDWEIRQTLLDQYRLLVESSERLVARRQTANTFLLSINTALLVIAGGD